MTEHEEWIDWLERWEIHYIKDDDRFFPYIQFAGFRVYFDHDGNYIEHNGGE